MILAKRLSNKQKEKLTQEFINGKNINDLIEEFAESLSLADDLILLDIYAAREENIYDITSNDLLKICRNKVKTLSNIDSVLGLISNKDLDVLITLGAGNISDIVSKIKENIS